MATPLIAVAAVLLAQAPAAAPFKLAFPGMSIINVDEKMASFYSEHLAQQLVFQGLKVTTAKEVQTILGHERQKQLMGCAETSSNCIAEIANALGVDGIVMGDLAKLGKTFQLNVKVVAAIDGKRMAGFSARVSSEEDLLAELDKGAKEMAAELKAAQKPAPPGPPAPVAAKPPDAASSPPPAQEVTGAKPSSGRRTWGWVGVGAGAALTIGGSLALLQAKNNHDALISPSKPLTLSEATVFKQSGELFQTLGWVGIGAGVAGVAAGTYLLLTAPSEPAPSLSFFVTPSGGAISLGGSFR
jgi:hypothetical protein